jgi:hypothetical protein
MPSTRPIRRAVRADALYWLIIVGLTLLLGLLAYLIFRELSSATPPARTSGTARLPRATTLAAASAPSTPASAEAPVDPDAAKDAWLDALVPLESVPISQALPEITRALQFPDRDVRLRALNLLVVAKDDPAILPLLAMAQRDADAEVRLEAVSALKGSRQTTDLTPYLVSGSMDANDEVRDAAIQTAWSLTPEQRDGFITQALSSSEAEVASAGFEMLKHEASRHTIEMLLNVYATNNPTQIQNANDVMSALLSQTFPSAAEASAWWQQHQGDYQDDLSPSTVASN